MTHLTSTGNLEIKHRDDKVMIILTNTTTQHEVGISIPKTHIWTFVNRRFFEGANESIEILVKGDKILINLTLNFKNEIHISTSVTREAWSKIESEIKGD